MNQSTSTFKDYISYLISLLRLNRSLDSEFKEKLLEEESLKVFEQAFTHKSFDNIKNYEVFEQLGDITFNKSLVWYFHTKYPALNTELGVKIVARLRIVYGSRKFLAQLSERYGLTRWVRMNIDKPTFSKLMAVHEDIFESFVGVLEYLVDSKIKRGLGYAICDKFITNILNETMIDFSYNTLFDAKTRLKELVDMYNGSLHNLKYTSMDFHVCVYITKKETGEVFHIAKVPIKTNKSETEQMASEMAIKSLEKIGYVKQIPLEYRNIVERLV